MSFSSFHRPIYWNESAASWNSPATASKHTHLIHDFHRTLPNYAPTDLISIDQVATDIGVRAVYLKDESQRMDLPSFKILGASWGVFRALAERFRFPLDSDLESVKQALSDCKVKLYAATDGNHGRAVARMGKILGVKVAIILPNGIHPATTQLIKDEGAAVEEECGSYDDAVRLAYNMSIISDGILVQDTAFTGYEEIPNWIVQGYSTMVFEINQQLEDQKADLVIVPVGVGSFAQSVVSHYKSPGQRTRVLAVEPDTAACLYTSLKKGRPITIKTSPTIMTGMDCGTVSSIAWPVLKAGIDVSLTVSDLEAHEACGSLLSMGVFSGPCGASTLAALRRLSEEDRLTLGLDRTSVVVLLSSEGPREYREPLRVLK